MINRPQTIRRSSPFVILSLLGSMVLCAQAPPPAVPLTLEQAVAAALQKYPAVRVSEAGVRAAAAEIQLARTAYLPQMSVLAGVNRATRNNVLGLLLPSQIFAPVTGPVLGTNTLASAWGSTVGVLVTWEPFDFGFRQANVAVAAADRQVAEAAVARTRLDVATFAAETVLTLVAAEQTSKAAQAAVERARELQRITEALVQAELRPGAESSLARAEQAAAQAQLIRAQQAVATARIALGSLLGAEPKSLNISAARLLLAPQAPEGSGDLSSSPVVQEVNARVRESEARLHVLDRSYFPKFSVQATSYARGTGALPDERLLGGVNGLAPNIQNWAVGFTVNFPVFEIASIRARRGAETARLEAERGSFERVLVDLKSRRDQALAAYEGAQQVAKTTPMGIEAAHAAVEQSTARYQSGLGTALDVADAQRRLAQAEIDDSLARLSIWRARLAVLSAEGDITPLLHEASQ